MSPIISKISSAGIINSTNGFNINQRRFGLYYFTSVTFTPGGATGNERPTLTQAKNGLFGSEVDQWKDNIEYFDVTDGIMLWTVPQTGIYKIESYGSKGGDNLDVSTFGGLGAYVRGNFSLSQGDKIKILVGQRLDADADCGGIGGGGGSFVVRNTLATPTVEDILVIAGGGGGAGRNDYTYNGTGGTSSTSGTNSPNSPAGSGGSNGNGGGIPIEGCANDEGGGGGGFFGNGTNQSSGFGGGKSFINGGGGGEGGSPSVEGGFGGGGKGGYGGGGGGGYSGGGAGGLSGSCECNIMGGGGGGGSYNNGTNQTNISAYWGGEGKVTISLVE